MLVVYSDQSSTYQTAEDVLGRLRLIANKPVGEVLEAEELTLNRLNPATLTKDAWILADRELKDLIKAKVKHLFHH